jgi:hypothetical protein
VAVATFLCLIAAAFGSLSSNAKLASEHLQEDTNETVRLIANIFVVMASLALGLMMNSAKNTFATNEENVHALATDLILLDRSMRALGSEADEAHRHLVEYVQQSLTDANIVEEDPQAEAFLDAVGTSLRAIRFSDERQIALWNDARELYRQTVRQRWIVVDASNGTIPPILIVMLIGWLVIIFASFGYRAPRNVITATSFVLAALLISATLFVIIDMDTPASGLMQASKSPFERVLRVLRS